MSKCKRCGAPLEKDEYGNDQKCEYCGEEPDINVKNININIAYRKIDEAECKRQENTSKEIDYNYRFISIAVKAIICLIIICLLLLLFLGLKKPLKDANMTAKGYINIGKISQYIGEDYKKVFEYLEGLGFKNIELYDLNDSDPVSKKPDTVTSVTINGDTSYEDNSFFPPDVIITIAHH